MIKNIWNKTTKTAKALAPHAGATAGGIWAGPLGAIAGGVIGDVLLRQLSSNQKSRIEKVIEEAVRVAQKVGAESKQEKQIQKNEYKELIEGALLAAAKSYEEKKIPLIARLLAIAPYTNTPIDNLNQTLIFAEQLSYRQLVIIGVVGSYSVRGHTVFKYSTDVNIPDEILIGILADLSYLVGLGFIESIAGIPDYHRLKLTYPGILLYNGLWLDQEKTEEWHKVDDTLKNEKKN